MENRRDRFHVDRRSFLSSVAASGILTPLSVGAFSASRAFGDTEGTGKTGESTANDAGEAKADHDSSAVGNFPEPLASYPVLQNPTRHGITVVWGVRPKEGMQTTGWVEWGTTKNLGETSRSAEFGLNPLNANFLSAAVTGLKPGVTYFYRTATRRIEFKSAYKISGTDPVFSDVYSFTTPASRGDSASFVVINDTHENQETLKALFARIEELNPDQIVWNGDLLNSFDRPEQALESIFCPQYGPVVASRPLLFNNGNHDHRGIWAREKSVALTPWTHNNLKFRGLGRNFAVRRGPLALIGLDTGEDKPDANPVFAGLADFEPYRRLQAKWLAETLRSKRIRTAPWVVAVCHIPLFDSRPDANPGDIMENFAAWQRPASQLWGPLLKEHGVPLVIAAHTHRFRYDAATEDRPWAQLVGGGPDLNKNATILYGRAEAGKLTVVAENLADRSLLGSWEFGPRR